MELLSRKFFSPVICQPLDRSKFLDLQKYVTSIKKNFAGRPYLDSIANRNFVHNPALLEWWHPDLVNIASEIFRVPVKPSYSFLSMYGDKGVLAKHRDRSQCVFTIDLCVQQSAPWEILIGDKGYLLQEGEAICYSGTDQEHWRNPIQPNGFCDMAFFHFVPDSFEGTLD
jgi:hypothetical protein